jgi:plastocyanin
MDAPSLERREGRDRRALGSLPMAQTAFFVIGVVLVLAAVALAALGLRNESFPASRPVFAAGLAVIALLVAGATTTAVLSARDEAEERESEEAAEAEQEAEVAEKGGGAGASTLDLSAPADGSLAFEPDTAEAPAGEVAIAFDNPAPIEHDVVVEQDGEQLAKSDLISEEQTSLSLALEPGEYVYYCDVPGHREGGMEGTLTVD